MKFFRNYILVVLGIVIIITLLQRFKVFPSWKNFFTAKSVVIEDTPILIREIKELSQLITVTSYDEVVADSIKASNLDIVRALTGLTTPLSPPGDQIVIIAKGKVQAGTELSYLLEQDIFIKDDSIRIVLPPAKVLDVITNPSDFSTFIEKGDWTPAEVNAVKQEARNKILQRALQNNILSRADQRSHLIMENFLRSLGFKKISIG
jgi:hypothetical protein